MARAVGVRLGISTKQSIELCNMIRGRKVVQARRMLTGVMDKHVAVPFLRFTNGLGHKRGMASGRFPVNASRQLLSLIAAAEANAQFKGINTSNLIISHIACQKAGNNWRYGRHKRRKMKSTHGKMVVEESKEAPKAARSEKAAKGNAPPVSEVKKNEKKDDVKEK